MNDVEACVDRERFVIDSLDGLFEFAKMLPISEFRLTEHIMGKNGTVLVRKGQSLTASRLEYLRKHDSYIPFFSFERTEGLSVFCSRQIKNALQQLITTHKTDSMTYAVTSLGKDFVPILDQVLSNPSLAYALFSQRYLQSQDSCGLFDHLILTGVLTACIARSLDGRFLDVRHSSEAMMSGILHDISIADYNKRVANGIEALEEETHTRHSARLAVKWGTSEDATHAILHHHSYTDPKASIPQAPSKKAEAIQKALATAECFITFVESMKSGDKEHQALFVTANYAKHQRLAEDAVKALGEIVRGKDILSDVDRIIALERECKHACAYAHPKYVHTTPTEVVCRGKFEECPMFSQGDAPLLIIHTMNDGIIREGFLSLSPGKYPKCRLKTRLTELFTDPLSRPATDRTPGRKAVG